MTATIHYTKTGNVQTVEIVNVEILPHVTILDLKDGGFYSYRPEDEVKIFIHVKS